MIWTASGAFSKACRSTPRSANIICAMKASSRSMAQVPENAWARPAPMPSGISLDSLMQASSVFQPGVRGPLVPALIGTSFHPCLRYGPKADGCCMVFGAAMVKLLWLG